MITQATALVLDQPGVALRLERRDLPTLQPGQIQVKMQAAPINPADLNMLEGTYPVALTLPGVPGCEGVGVVTRTGVAVAELKVGVEKDTLRIALESPLDNLLGFERAPKGDQELDKFAELLFDMVAASEQHAERLRLAAAVGAIYSYLDAKKAPASLNRYYILKDLEKYIKESQ